MFVVSFYSYKGGVGRTLAVVNTAYRLAQMGRKVFILDFDLEAPGIDAFGLWGDKEPRKGLLEYISGFMSTQEVPPLREFVHMIESQETQPGQIFVMPAGNQDQSYQRQLSRINWKHFYREQKGFLFVDNLKGAIRQEYTPDYVLIDSRTGLTDIAGICTLQLPDVVVLLFNLNNQNIAGIAQIYRSIRFNRLNRDIKTVLVASPISDVPDYVGIRRERLDYAQRAIGGEIRLVLPFDPFVAFEERIVKSEKPKTYLARSYDALTKEIVSENRSDMRTMLNEARQLREQGNVELADLRYQELTESNPGDARAWLEYGLFLKMQRQFKPAVQCFEKATNLDPKGTKAVAQLAATYLELKRKDKATAYLERFLSFSNSATEIAELADVLANKGFSEEAIRVYERANQLRDSWSGQFEIGNNYMRMKQPEKAVPYYERVVEAKPTSLAGVYNLGYALSLRDDSRAADYFKRAINLFQQEGAAGHGSLSMANYHQALSHAYVGIGEIERALQALDEAVAIATKVSPQAPIFSSLQYMHIPAEQFLKETQQMQRRLRRRRN